MRKITMIFALAALITTALPARAKESAAPPDRIILLDPGHGGIDAGAVSKKYDLREKDITLLFALDLQKALSKRGGHQAFLTRETDRYVSLEERMRLVQALQPDLFISLHADSSPRARTRGFAVYVSSRDPSDLHAGRLAERENGDAERILGVNPQTFPSEALYILFDLSRQQNKSLSRGLARTLLDHAGRVTHLLPKPHRYANFQVLSNPDVPSVLIELGFLSNRADGRRLASETFRKRLAKNLARALDRFFEERRAAMRFQ